MTNRREFLKSSAAVAAAITLAPGSMRGQNTKKSTSAVPASVDTYKLNMGAALNIPTIQPRKITIPDAAGFKVLKGDFHIHTLFSDGLVMPKDRVDEAVQNGLDAIAITDHIEVRPYFSKTGKWKLDDETGSNFNLSYETAKPEADKQNLLLIPGTEITKSTMPPGHFNALFTQDVNPIAAVVDDWREMLRVAADQGCFLLWDHPGWEGQIGEGTPLRFMAEHEEAYRQGWMHGIEIFNGYQYYPIVSDWCNERDLAIFANSDIHPRESQQYGVQNPARPITLVLAKERTTESIREAMFAKRTIGWAANMLWGRAPWLEELFKASVGIRTITPGTLELTNNSSLPIIVSLGGIAFDLHELQKREVYRAEGVKQLTVLNWMIGMNQPLQVPLD